MDMSDAALRELARRIDDFAEWRRYEILVALRSAARAEQREQDAKRPRIVCLCGSTRFMDAFFDAGRRLTLEGKIVLSVGVWREGPPDHAGEWIGEDVKRHLDELHKRKIDLADEVFVLNVGGYIGDSTRSEIEYAIAHGKPVAYLVAAAAIRAQGGGR